MFNVSSSGQISSDNHISNYLADNSFVPSDVPVGTGCAPLAAGSHLVVEMKFQNTGSNVFSHKTRRRRHQTCPSLGRAEAGPQVAGIGPPGDY